MESLILAKDSFPDVEVNEYLLLSVFTQLFI